MTTTVLDSARLLEGLNEAQREAASIATGPLAIIAGAGSGKTRVISHRAAYAIETGAVAADRVLLVTFTEKAATEMVSRMSALGHPGVAARTFHAAALAQLRHFWPSRHGGSPAPAILDSKARLLVPLARRLPGGYAFTTVKDLAEAIEWAKVRRIAPEQWEAEGADRAPIPANLFARLYADYERGKVRAGVIDFEDMLVETVRLLETDAEAAELVRSRKTWFSVDEYQDTNALSERLLELWLGESRDLAVVGDPDQTIYSFTGATPAFLVEFERRHPGARVVALNENYRSSPEILALANRLVEPGMRGALRATQPMGVTPTIRRYPTAEAEIDSIVEAIARLTSAGTEPSEIAVLVRINAQLPEIEAALTRAGIPFRVRGQRFFERPEVREARRLLARTKLEATGPGLARAVRALFVERLGLDGAGDGGRQGSEAAERAASLELLVDLVKDLAGENGGLALPDVVAELDRRDAGEAEGAGGGVNLLTYHRAKGLEWDAVFLPALEEGLLPIRQAKEEDQVAEERRLLYVGITRARRHLALSWAARRVGQQGKEGARKPSRFLDALDSSPAARRSHAVGAAMANQAGGVRPRIRALERDSNGLSSGISSPADAALLEALHGWRRARARADAVPAYVVAHDALLVEIAAARPRSATALQSIKGMGPAKVERYGDDILALIARVK
jgi:DNA helicase-2/ATP-dependent DNA helicase PcrA